MAAKTCAAGRASKIELLMIVSEDMVISMQGYIEEEKSTLSVHWGWGRSNRYQFQLA